MAKLNDVQQTKLLNYVLGEMASDEKTRFEMEMRSNPEFEPELRDLKATLALAEETLEAEPVPRLPPQMMERFRSEMEGHKTFSVLPFLRPHHYAMLAAACLVIVIGVLFRQPEFEAAKQDLKPESIALEEAKREAPQDATAPPPPAEPMSEDSVTGVGPKATSEVADSLKSPTAQQITDAVAITGAISDFERIEMLAMRGNQIKGSGGAQALKDSFAPQAAKPGTAELEAADEIAAAMPEADDAMIMRQPKRVAMMATSVGINKETLQVLASKEQAFVGCFRDGYDPHAFLSMRVFVGAGGKVTQTQSVEANKMPISERVCVTEVVENTVFSSAGPGGSFTLLLRPLPK